MLHIELSKEASEKLLHELMHPDIEAIEKRDKYLASINQTVTKNKDGLFTIDCPDLDLSDITKGSRVITDKDLFRLAGDLAIASRNVIKSTTLSISERVKQLEIALNEYDNAIMERANES